MLIGPVGCGTHHASIILSIGKIYPRLIIDYIRVETANSIPPILWLLIHERVCVL